MISGVVPVKRFPTSMPVITETGDGTSPTAADRSWTGSVTTTTSLTGDSAWTRADRKRSRRSAGPTLKLKSTTPRSTTRSAPLSPTASPPQSRARIDEAPNGLATTAGSTSTAARSNVPTANGSRKSMTAERSRPTNPTITARTSSTAFAHAKPASPRRKRPTAR